MTKQEALAILQGADHCLISAKGVKEISSAFGVDIKPIKYKDNRSDFKGLCLNGNKEGDMAEGLDAAVLASTICDRLKLAYPQMFGRGSQLRVCCKAISKVVSDE